MVIEISEFGFEPAPDVHHQNLGIEQVLLGGLPSEDRTGRLGKQDRAGEELVFVGSARMGYDG